VVRLIFVLSLACALCWGGGARAATVAILRPASGSPLLDEALFRLKGELLAVGLAVAIADRPPFRDTASAEATAWFEATAAERDIDAFFDVVGENKPVGVDIWLCERAPRRVRVARVVLEPNTENAAATLAIRAIEVLRSSFLAIELSAGGEPRPPVPSPPRAETAAAAPEHVARLALEAGATAITGVNGVGPAVLPLVRFDWALRSWLSIQATGAAFGTRPHVETPAGDVQVAQQFGLLGLCLCALANTGIHPIVALSAGALHTTLDGRADAPNVGHELDEWAFLVDGSVGARLSLPDRFYVTLAAHVQLAEPYVAIHVLDTVVATSGSPNLLLALTVGARL
jgi:hypothetical protein